MPDITLDPGHPLRPEDVPGPDHDEGDDTDEDGDVIARVAQEEARPGVGLPAAGIAQEFGNERSRERPD